MEERTESKKHRPPRTIQMRASTWEARNANKDSRLATYHLLLRFWYAVTLRPHKFTDLSRAKAAINTIITEGSRYYQNSSEWRDEESFKSRITHKDDHFLVSIAVGKRNTELGRRHNNVNRVRGDFIVKQVTRRSLRSTLTSWQAVGGTITVTKSIEDTGEVMVVTTRYGVRRLFNVFKSYVWR